MHSLRILIVKMLKKFNFHYLSGGVLLLLTFSLQASVFRGKIEGFELSTCHLEKCFQLSAPIAFVSYLDGNYAFDEAKFTLQEKSGLKRTLASRDVYYDHHLLKVFVRNVEGADYVYDVKSGVLTKFGN